MILEVITMDLQMQRPSPLELGLTWCLPVTKRA